MNQGTCYYLASYDVYQTWWWFRREGHAPWDKAQGFVCIQKVKARVFGGTRKMEAGFVRHGVGELKTAGIR